MNFASRIACASLLFFALACGPNPKEENKQLREEIIAIHDEVMPLIGKLKSLEKKALEEAESLESAEEVDSTRVEALKALAYDLNQAHESMFVWMRQYETEDGELTTEEVKAYLEDQMIQVSAVNVDIKAALEKAEQMLGD
ncbi:hypothetical protein [Algoriphagus namhaensis]